MFPIDVRPDRAVEELLEFNRKLGEGFKSLQDMGELESGVSPREAVYEEDKLVLYRYTQDESKVTVKTPLLIVYALVNRPYMTDLQENRSTIKGMLDAGLDVYLIDWGYPDGGDRFIGMDDYINGYIDRCVDVIRERHGIEKVNLLGICQGGTFSLCYSALHQDKVRNLVTMVTPVDFQTPDNLLSHWVQDIDVDTMVDSLGNVPGELLNWTFLSLKPLQLTGQKYLDMVNLMEDPKAARNFMRMEKWIFDSPDQAGGCFREFTKTFFQQNRFIEGGLEIGGQPVSLKDVTMPVLNIYARHDHLVPPAASQAMKGRVGTKDYTELDFPGGHIGIYVSGKAQKTVPPAIGEWLAER
ncbi:MAG: class III poly(R)-hydroxyalkanoic acid synthase subunit PhaC [Gammaproteobacteria bacterium]|nr:class III poly(R)-hydroxyalkanoic acid synthase subunit PhaC [Gammaproteobacteria bacterium]